MDIYEALNELNRFDEDYFCEMARIGWIPPIDTKGVEVYVMTNDRGNVPHFHIRKYGDNHQFEWETCIQYTSAEYFKHGKYINDLPRVYGKKLDGMLRQNNPKDPGRTYWQSAIVAWNVNNSEIELPFDLVQPDYSVL